MGAALGKTGLAKRTTLGMSTLVIANNLPDVDVAVFATNTLVMSFRRGWTHGVLALALWPFVLTGVLLAWDRWVRRRRDPGAVPARAGTLLWLTALAVVTHPALDWLNNYGLRWLMPFSGQWFYGDALFVVDPWMWLLLGGAAFLTFSKSKLARVRWAVFAAAATWLILVNDELVPLTTRVLWVVGLGLALALRWRLRDARPVVLERAALIGIAAAAVYVVTLVASSAAARAEVRAAVAARGIEAESVMVAPVPGDPFGGDVVVMTADEYYSGRFNWLMTPRLRFGDERMPRPRGVAYQLAVQSPAARRFLVWSRYPVVDVEPISGGGTRVRFTDMRYRSTEGILGPTVDLLENVAGD